MLRNLKIGSFVVVMLMAAALFLTNAQAAAPTDVAQAAALMRASPKAKQTKFDGTEISFVANGKIYGLWYSKEAKLLSVWIRLRDAKGQKILIGTFSDQGLDGTVDFGINGKDGTDKDKQYFNVEEDRPGKNSGEEFRPHWQDQYDQTIKVALSVLKK